ncbi:FGL1L protein, partial [Regulus satrapa]|nr:FGL1L protein [Regulus satrapa]
SPSGTCIIQPTHVQTIFVYSDVSGADRGWTIIQRDWQSSLLITTYKCGFGNTHTGFWLGTKYVHQITRQNVCYLGSSNNMKFAEYNLFSLENESQSHQLMLGVHLGTGQNAVASKGTTTMHDNMKSSVKDRDQDTHSGSCAASSGGMWRYSVF